MQSRWILPTATDAVLTRRLAEELDLSMMVAGLLMNRGFTTPEQASHFLDPRLAFLRPPEEIPGISEAARRILQAVLSRERITLYGDYDVDGITSLAILSRFLKRFGIQADCFIPDRATEGYGLSSTGLTRCLKEHHPELLIALDCGTNSRAEAQELQKSGCGLLIIDHHEPGNETAVPFCAALVNPKLGADFHYLCTAGIVFKLCHALLKLHPVKGLDLRDYLDLVAVGTVADIVPLTGENRIFVRAGLRQLASSCWPGLKALLEVSGATPPYTPADIGFKIAPRINAAGRLGDALEALNLLLSEDTLEAGRIATCLDQQNRERQSVERDVTKQAEEWVSAHFDPQRDASIVAGERHWHQGVVGIVAPALPDDGTGRHSLWDLMKQGRAKEAGAASRDFPLWRP